MLNMMNLHEIAPKVLILPVNNRIISGMNVVETFTVCQKIMNYFYAHGAMNKAIKT